MVAQFYKLHDTNPTFLINPVISQRETFLVEKKQKQKTKKQTQKTHTPQKNQTKTK